MALGRTQNMLEMRLRQLEGKVLQLRLKALGAGESPGADPANPTVAARLTRLQQDLAEVQHSLSLVARELSSIGHLLDLRARVALRLGRETRRRERQSIRSSAMRQQELYQLLADIHADIADLTDAAGGCTSRERIEMMNEVLEKMAEFRKHVAAGRTVLQVPDGPALTSPQLVTANISLEGIVLASFVLLEWLRRKSRG